MDNYFDVPKILGVKNYRGSVDPLELPVPTPCMHTVYGGISHGLPWHMEMKQAVKDAPEYYLQSSKTATAEQSNANTQHNCRCK